MHQNSDYVQTNENMTSGDTMKKALMALAHTNTIIEHFNYEPNRITDISNINLPHHTTIRTMDTHPSLFV